jgi:hypothetical protein
VEPFAHHCGLESLLLWCNVRCGSAEERLGYHPTSFSRISRAHFGGRNSDARTFIVDHFPKRNPSVVHADFDGDGHPDYAILLKDKKSGTTKLVVLLCSRDAQCKSVFELDVTTSSGEVYVRPIPAGSRVSQTEAIDTKDYPPPVRLGSVGIEVTYFGQAKIVYYWNRKHKKIETVQTED